MRGHAIVFVWIFIGMALTSGCRPASEEVRVWQCVLGAETSPEFSQVIGCEGDFKLLASEPLDASIPGALSVKTVIDRADGNALYFQNSTTYPIHWDFAHTHLSGNGKPIVTPLAQFNQTEYFSPDRRFNNGAVSYYQGPDVRAYEIAPYDSAGADLITEAYRAIRDATYFGQELFFHPSSDKVALEAKNLPEDVKIITSEELYKDIVYQPLNLGTAIGRLRFFTAAQLETDYPTFRDIVVLDHVPNDISVVSAIITAVFQTPLSHINVLSQNRGTPNMALKNAHQDPTLLALQDKWVRLTVTAFNFAVEEVTKEEADVWWEAHKPTAVQVPNLDLSVTDLVDIEKVLGENVSLGGALDKAIPAFGGKASHYSALTRIGADVPLSKAFAVPVYFYRQFMEENGFLERVKKLLADETFLDDPATRDHELSALRQDMLQAPVNPTFASMLLEKLKKEYPNTRMRFRSSTNAEDLDGFTGAGLYISLSGDPDDPSFPVLDAVRGVWSSVWYFRAFEERSYRSIDQLSVAMALLVHESFPNEEATGVALTANLYDTSGLEPGFYINVQYGGTSVVKPDPGIATDQFIYHFYSPGQPIVFMSHSNLIPEGTTVLTSEETYVLGKGLSAIHEFFKPLYGSDSEKWYAMDVEFKFDGPLGETPSLFFKQARPHPGWGQK
jgi:pyruvate, water dikinase